MTLPLEDRIRHRASRAGLSPDAPLVASAAVYLRELAHWNRTINLTACRLDPEPDDTAIDRLVIEPLAAAPHVPGGAESLIDIGSGGGSPAIPLVLALPKLHVLMVEQRARKAAFLRHAIRALDLSHAAVAATRLESLAASAVPPVELLSMRAVRFDAALARVMARLTLPAATLLWFAPRPSSPLPEPWRIVATKQLLPEPESTLLIVQKGLPRA